MSMNLDSISVGAQLRAPRMLILGVEKIGKSCFACGTSFANGELDRTGLNAPVVLSVKGEEGVDGLDVAKFPTANTYDDIMEGLASLYMEGHDYRTVVIDSASALEPLIFDAVCREHGVASIEKVDGGYGKGYLEALSKWRDLCNGMDALRDHKGMCSILIGHVKVKRFDDPTGESFDQYQFDINDKASNLLARWADVTLFANTKVIVKTEDKGFKQTKKQGLDITGGQRFLFTQKRPAHPGGGRGIYGQLPYELPLDWAVFENAVAQVVQRNNEQHTEETE